MVLSKIAPIECHRRQTALFALMCEPGPLGESDLFEMFVRVFYPIGLGFVDLVY